MASCQASDKEDGYATPAALVVGLTIALLASGLLARSAADLRSARYDFRRAQIASALSADAAAALSDAVFAQFGVSDAGALRARLTAAAASQGHVLISDLDVSSTWRFCAPSIISLLGQAEELRYTTPSEPGPGPLPSSWHIGEAWLVSVATPEGWRDNRIVRFTGNAQRPAATVTRRFFRTTTTGEQPVCEDLLNALAAG